MTDQIEKWRKDFECIMKKERPLNSLARLPDDSAYIDRDTFYLEQGFLMAKRNINPIAIPPVWRDQFGHQHVSLQSMTMALNISGYPYTLPGE
jgi:hypothetical protein